MTDANVYLKKYLEKVDGLLGESKEIHDRFVCDAVISADGTPIYTYEIGSHNKETIVIFSPVISACFKYSMFMEALSKKYRVISWNNRGCILSDSEDCSGDFDLMRHVEDFNAVVNSKGVSSAHVIGLCAGVPLAVWSKLHTSFNMKSLVFICPMILGDSIEDEGVLTRVLMTVHERLKQGEESAIEVFRRGLFTWLEGNPPEILKEFLVGTTRKFVSDVESCKNFVKTIGALLECNAETIEMLQELKNSPVLLQHSMDDEDVNPINIFNTKNIFSNAKYIFYSGLTHDITYLSPDQVAKDVFSFYEDQKNE